MTAINFATFILRHAYLVPMCINGFLEYMLNQRMCCSYFGSKCYSIYYYYYIKTHLTACVTSNVIRYCLHSTVKLPRFSDLFFIIPMGQRISLMKESKYFPLEHVIFCNKSSMLAHNVLVVCSKSLQQAHVWIS